MDNVPPEGLSEMFKESLNRSRRWIGALGWLAFIYGILSIARVGVSALMTLGFMSSTMGYPFWIGIGSGLMSLIVCFFLIPIGILLIRAGLNLDNYLKTDDFTRVIAYEGKIKTSAILAVCVLIIDILSNVVSVLLMAAVAAMPSLTGFGD